MVLKKEKKKNIINKINEIAKKSISVVIADYTNIKANKMNELRKCCRNNGVYIKIIRNTLMSLSIKNTIFECIKDVLKGQNIIAFSDEKQPGEAAKLFKIFNKENNTLKIKAASFEGKMFKNEKIDFLSKLPSHKEAISKLIFIFKEIYARKLLRLLIAISKKK